MIKQLKINDKSSYDDFGVYIADRNISPPKKKSIKETVPFSNKVYDFSKINGEIYWEERTLEYSFDIAEITTEEMESIKSKLLDWLLNVHDTDIYDPYIEDYHFHGSYDNGSWVEDFGAGTITVTFSVYPYMISNYDSEVVELIGNSDDGTLINSVFGNVKELIINGASEQETTQGNQLIDFNLGSNQTGVTKTFENGILTIVGDGSVSYQSWSKPITDIVINNPNKELYFDFEKIETVENFNGTVAQITVKYNDGTSNLYKALYEKSGSRNSWLIPSDSSNIETVTFGLYSSNNPTAMANTLTITKPMLQFGADKLEYEEYTGGINSPNPDYPQEIISVGDNGSVEINAFGNQLVDFGSGNGSSGVTVTFENDILTLVGDGSYKWQNYSINITNVVKNNPSKELYFDFETVESVNDLDGTIVQLNISKTDGTYDYRHIVTRNLAQTGYNIPSDTSIIKSVSLAIYTTNNSAESMANTLIITKPMLQFGRDKIEYETYKGTTTILTLSEPLRSLPNGVCDTYENGVITRRVGSVVLNGSETWTKNNGWETNGISCFYHIVTERESRSYAICDKFVTKSFVDSMIDGKISYECLRYDSQAIYFFIKTERLTSDDVDGFITWLGENNITVFYELVDPTTETIEFPTIPTYEDKTYIFLNHRTTFEVNYNEIKNITIYNNSSHRIAPTIISDGQFIISLNGVSYSVGEGTYNEGFYLESGENEITLIGYGKITFSYIEEVF